MNHDCFRNHKTVVTSNGCREQHWPIRQSMTNMIFCECILLVSIQLIFVLKTAEGSPQIQQLRRPCDTEHPSWTCNEVHVCSEGPKGANISSGLCNSNELCCEVSSGRNRFKRATNSTVEKKCEKYAEYVYTYMDSPALFGDESKIRIDTCGIAAESVILGGTAAERKEFPHMAGIGFGNDTHAYWLCGASLISERYLLSAAHCIEVKGRGQARWAKLGALNLYAEGEGSTSQLFEIVELIVHPDYTKETMYNDIALFKLEKDVVFNEHVRPLCLHSEAEITDKRAIATGWGRTRIQGLPSPDLMKVTLDVIDALTCNETLKKKIGRKLPIGIDPKTMICAGRVQGKDTCRGDSGGPLQTLRKDPYCMYSLVGITSFGPECGSGEPAVYTKVSHYIDWIESIVWP